MKRTRIKICGITSIDDALLAVSSGCDALGFNFYLKSPRFIETSEAKKICDLLPTFVNKVALFVNPDEALVKSVLDSVNIDTLQFHGNESPNFCQKFSKSYIKVLSIKSEKDSSQLISQINQYKSATGILLDSYDPINIGGSGNVFNWNTIPEDCRTNIILAGGLNSENVGSAIETNYDPPNFGGMLR